MPSVLSPSKVASIVNSFLERVSHLNLKNYDNDVLLIKDWAGEAREELRGVDVGRPDLDPKTLTVMKELAAGKQEDDRIIGLALMAHNAARTGGNLAAQAALFIHLSGPAGYVLAREPDATWEKLPKDVREAMADLAGNIFGNGKTQEAVRDAVLSLKTEKIAGLVAYVASGRMEGDVAYWEDMEPLPGQSRPSLAEYIRDAIGFSCADAVLKADPKIVDGLRQVSVEVNGGSPSSNDRVASRNRPDRLVITPNDRGGAERLTMVLAFSGNDSSGQYFGDYLETLDAITHSGSKTPFAGVPVNLIYINSGSFIASGQTSGAGVKLSIALEGATLDERQDLATLPLLSTPLQWKSKKLFTDFFRFNPLVLGSSTLRWYHFVEKLAGSRMSDDGKRREALLWTIDRFSNALRAIDLATSQADYAEGGVQQQVNSTLEKSTLLLNELAYIGGDVLTQKDYDKAVKPLAKQVQQLANKLLADAAGRNVSILQSANAASRDHLKKSSFTDFTEKHDGQLQAKGYITEIVSCVVQQRAFERFQPVDKHTARRIDEISSYFGVSDAIAQGRLLQRRKDIQRLLKDYSQSNADTSERTSESYRSTVERVAATLASDEIWNEVVRGNPTPSVIDKNGFCEMSPDEQEEHWAELRGASGKRLRAVNHENRFSDQQKALFQSRQEDIASILIARQEASTMKPDNHYWKSQTALLTKLAGLASPMLWQLLLPEPDGTKSPIGPEDKVEHETRPLPLAEVRQRRQARQAAKQK